MQRWRFRLMFAAGAAVLLLLGAYFAVRWEGSSARRNPPNWESSIGQWLLAETVPADAKSQANPLAKNPDAGDLGTGQMIYRQKCEICHAYDGSGHSDIGAGQYPHPPDLRSALVQAMTDGELRYHIANGIRHT